MKEKFVYENDPLNKDRNDSFQFVEKTLQGKNEIKIY